MQDIIPMIHLFKGILMTYSNIERLIVNVLSKPNLIPLNELTVIQKIVFKNSLDSERLLMLYYLKSRFIWRFYGFTLKSIKITVANLTFTFNHNIQNTLFA